MLTKIKRFTTFVFIGSLAMSSLTISAFAQNAPRDRHPMPMDRQHDRVHGQNMPRISWSQMVIGLERQGYNIREIEANHEGWKAEVFDENHVRYELYLNGQGAIVHKKYDE